MSLRLLFVVLTSWDKPVYEAVTKLRQQQFQFYGVDYVIARSGKPPSNYQPSPYDVTFDNQTVKGKYPPNHHMHEMVPHMWLKTQHTLKSQNLSEYDYVVRVNATTFVNIPALIRKLHTAPRRRFVAGHVLNLKGEFVSGMCIVMSSDVATSFVSSQLLSFPGVYQFHDDVMWGRFLASQHLQITPWNKYCHFQTVTPDSAVPERLNTIIVRVKNDTNRLGQDVATWHKLISYFDHVQSVQDWATYDPLTCLGLYHGTDKAYWHRYTEYYHGFLSVGRFTPVTILEIGVLGGASVRMWADYFPLATIIGVDINPMAAVNNPRVHLLQCDASNYDMLDTLVSKYGGFDIVVEDGSHTMADQQNTWCALWRHVKAHGWYICEDLHTSLSVASPDSTLNVLKRVECNRPMPDSKFIHDPMAWRNIKVQWLDFYERAKTPITCYRCRQSWDTHTCQFDWKQEPSLAACAQKGELRIGFWKNKLSMRGTEVAIYDYADYAETLLECKSYILTPDPTTFQGRERDVDMSAYQKFGQRFPILYYQHETDVDTLARRYQLDVLYCQKAGPPDSFVSNRFFTGVHAVFDTKQPHGHVTAAISHCLNRMCDTDLPVVPYMIRPWPEEPKPSATLREELHIPAEATVFGRYGGLETFDIPFVQHAVLDVAEKHAHIHFVFMHTDKWFPDSIHLPNIHFLPGTADMARKAAFVNTCDAMLHARKYGETFGLAPTEFALKGKTVLTNAVVIGHATAHWDYLGDYICLYQDYEHLYRLLTQKYAARQGLTSKLTPEHVMSKFQHVFLGPRYSSLGRSP